VIIYDLFARANFAFLADVSFLTGGTIARVDLRLQISHDEMAAAVIIKESKSDHLGESETYSIKEHISAQLVLILTMAERRVDVNVSREREREHSRQGCNSVVYCREIKKPHFPLGCFSSSFFLHESSRCEARFSFQNVRRRS